jgi:uncharacterized protein HemX|tara:strand:+ start:356 stop:640 length:285 start_codon:yes stop_codon:yes gene_type:complete
MSKGISENAQIHISIAFLIKAMIAVGVVVGSWYQAQMQFANIESRLNDLHEEVVILSSKVANMEQEHINEIEHHNEELIEENRSLLQKMGLKRP